jgi:hypothetical protein
MFLDHALAHGSRKPCVRLAIKPQIPGRLASKSSVTGNKKAENSINAKTMPSKLFKMN